MNSTNVPGGFNKAGSNRYIKVINGGIAFYSYSTLVVVVKDNQAYKTSEYYSVTTSRHINQFVRDNELVNVKSITQKELELLID